MRIAQLNVNHSWGAQDLLIQWMRENNVAIACIAEPHTVPESSLWYSDLDGSAAVHWLPHVCPVEVIPVESGDGFVVVRIGLIRIYSVYFSPNERRDLFEERLDRIAASVRGARPSPVLIAGDFNAASVCWGSVRTNPRGESVEEWAASLDLVLLNRGAVPTCVRTQGSSVVDLTWCSSNMSAKMMDWRVILDLETLSDHSLIMMEMRHCRSKPSHLNGDREQFPKWSTRNLDHDLLSAALILKDWLCPQPLNCEAEVAAQELEDLLTEASDVAAPRCKGQPSRRQTYWWNRDLADLRRKCNAMRRKMVKFRRRRNIVEAEITRAALRNLQRVLRAAIARAKTMAWQELISTLERYPWGRPYQTVMQRLKPRSLAATERMEVSTLTRVVRGLFPDYPGAEIPLIVQRPDMAFEPVTLEEVKSAVRDIKRQNTAPGPDGITIGVLLSLMAAVPGRFRDCINACISQGRFPRCWKVARLVLIPKAGKPHGLPSSYRPLCLLSEVGKLYERILARRIMLRVDERGRFSCRQFGFCKGKSICDAVDSLSKVVSRAIANRGVCVAVSLDIRNAFNTLPWPIIRDALNWWRMPQYLKTIIADYLSCRYIKYVSQDGMVRRTRVSCGVPQGSVLGPLLWNITYDLVLRLQVPSTCMVLCYADDTMVVAEGRTIPAAISSVNRGLVTTVKGIRALGLSIAPDKTEAIVFRSRRCRALLKPVRVENTDVMPIPVITYLGILLDEHWTFADHFQAMCVRGRKIVTTLSRIMPNIGGPSERRRVLYMHVLHSVLLYGAPIWGKLAKNRGAIREYRSMQKQVAIRVICAYLSGGRLTSCKGSSH